MACDKMINPPTLHRSFILVVIILFLFWIGNLVLTYTKNGNEFLSLKLFSTPAVVPFLYNRLTNKQKIENPTDNMKSRILSENANVYVNYGRKREPMTLLSTNCSVVSDVRGNLGAPSVITQEGMNNWLADRWQAALNMGGRPIPGEHYVEIDLQRLCLIEKVVIDWEDGYSDSWTIQGLKDTNMKEYVILGKSNDARTISKSRQHVIHEVHTQYSRNRHVLNKKQDKLKLKHKRKRQKNALESPSSVQPTDLTGERGVGVQSDRITVRYVRLTIHRPATEWGSSIWRLQLWGVEEGDMFLRKLKTYETEESYG